jgi:hypothetical protein
MLLVFVFAVVVLMLPIGLEGLRQLCDMVLLQQSKAYLAQVLPASYKYLDQAWLAEGQPVLKASEADSFLRSWFNARKPAPLADRLQLDSIMITERRIAPDPAHWMGGNQPQHLPVVILRAVFVDHLGRAYALQQSIEMLLD